MIQSLPAVGGSLLYRCSDVHDPSIHLIHHHYTSGFMSFLLLKSTLQLTLAPLWCQCRRLTSHLSFPWRIIPHYSLLMPCLWGGDRLVPPRAFFKTHTRFHTTVTSLFLIHRDTQILGVWELYLRLTKSRPAFNNRGNVSALLEADACMWQENVAWLHFCVCTPAECQCRETDVFVL